MIDSSMAILVTSPSGVAAMAVTATIILGIFRPTNAFSSCPLARPLLRGRSVVPRSSLRFAANHSNDEEKDDPELLSCDMSTNPSVLNWNLESLLSSDPSMDARFIPLMTVYDAAAKAAAEKATGDENETSMRPNNSDAEDPPSHAPSRLHTNPVDQTLAPLRSLNHNGPLPPSVAPYRMFVREYNRDMGHDGRFTVFDEDDTKSPPLPSLQSDVVFSMDDPLAFIRDSLSYIGGGASTWNSNEDREAVVFIPGLHTTHDPGTANDHSDELPSTAQLRSSPDRLKYISQVLDGLPMAQIHTGTHIDQGSLDVELTSDTISSLLSFDLLSEEFRKNLSLLSMNGTSSSPPKKAHYRLRARDLDILHSVLSRAGSFGSPSLSRDIGDKYLGSDSRGLKDTLIRLIDIAVRSVREEQSLASSSSSSPSPSPHLVLITYSATSNVLMSALSEWKNRVTTPIYESPHLLSDNESTKASCRDGIGVGVDESSDRDNLERKLFSEEEVELLLHKALTVVTISALSRGFVDGPAYIHVSMNDDPLAASLGISKSNPEGGGKDAVILQALSPYLIDDEDDTGNDTDSPGTGSVLAKDGKNSSIFKNDAHNIDSCVIQYLSLVRRINGVTSFREMYNVGIDDSDTKKLDISTSLFAIDYRSVGQLIMPPCIDTDLIPAMIRATGGERWLWNPGFQLGEGGVDGFDSPLPSLECAQAELENQLGYNAYDEIVENCCHK